MKLRVEMKKIYIIFKNKKAKKLSDCEVEFKI